MSHPSVHPLEAPPLTDVANNPPRVRMKDIQGTPAGLALRLCQFGFAIVAFCVMATTYDFASATSFRYLVAAVGLQSLWSLSLTIVDIYALLVKRSLRNSRVVSLFTIGDGITSTLTFAAASYLLVEQYFLAMISTAANKLLVLGLRQQQLWPS